LRIVAIIQARMASTRLPGKVLKDIGGEPMLSRVVSRLRRSSVLSDVIIATTKEPQDDAIANLCCIRAWRCFRGSQGDVLDRYYQTALTYSADVVVRITSDCPLIEPEIVDQVISSFLVHQPQLDYAANILPPRTFPRGLDTEVMRFDALERAWHLDKNPAWREHVTSFIQRNADLFSTLGITNDRDLSFMRWTVDTPEDLAFVRLIYDALGHDDFSWHDVLGLLEQHPDWLKLNRDIDQKVVL
jgi:spore coat polysaccharide biosynthesis protein SpsF